MGKTKMSLIKVEMNSKGLQGFLTDDQLRAVLVEPADMIRSAIPASDGDPGTPRKKGEKQLHGRYAAKFTDKDANALDGRVAIDVGVKYADRGFFRLMTLQKAIRSTGAKLKRNKNGGK